MRNIELICSYELFVGFIKLRDQHIGGQNYSPNRSNGIFVLNHSTTEYDGRERIGVYDDNTGILFKIDHSFDPHKKTKKVVFTADEWKLIKLLFKADDDELSLKFKDGLLFIEQFYHNQQNLLNNSHNKRKLYRRMFYANSKGPYSR